MRLRGAVEEEVAALVVWAAEEEARGLVVEEFAAAEARVTGDKQFELLEEVLGEEAGQAAEEELRAARVAEELLSEVLQDECAEVAARRLAWAREAAVLSGELAAAAELQEARRAAVLRVAKSKLSAVQAEVAEQEGRVRLMHGIMKHLDLNLEIATSLQEPRPAPPAYLPPPPPAPTGTAPLHPSCVGSLMRSLQSRAAEYECGDALGALEDARTSAAAALRTSRHALASKSARLASLKTHLSAVKEHLKGIDPKLVKVRALTLHADK